MKKLKNTMELVSTELLNKISGGVDLFANNNSHYRMPTVSGYVNGSTAGHVQYSLAATAGVPYTNYITVTGSVQGDVNTVQSKLIEIDFRLDF